MKITEKSARKVELPEGVSDRVFFDDDCRGFGVRVREGNQRVWVYQYRFGTKQRRMTLGAVNSVPLVLARKNAGQLEAKIRLGEDPRIKAALARQDAGNTFLPLAEDFLAALQEKRKPATVSEYTRHLRVNAKALHRLPVTAITQADIVKILNGAAGDVSRNRLRATLSALFTWIMQQGVVLPQGNPVSNTEKRDEKSRERALRDDELKAVWAAFGNDGYGHILKLLILTGARRDEIGALKWRELKDGKIELPGERTKNGRAHTIPLSKAAKAVVATIPRTDRVHVFGRDDTGFQGWSKCKERLDRKLGDVVTDWTVHDLRRTAASGMQRLGVRVEVIERALNHVSGSFRGVAGTYQRDPMTDDVRDALERWAWHVTNVVEGRDAAVVPFKRA